MRKPKRRVSTARKKPSPSTSSKTTRGKRTARSKPASQGYDRGATGFQKARKEQTRRDEEYQRKKDTPYNFKITPGEEAEVVVLDTEEPYFLHLHKVQNRHGRWVDEVCIADQGVACPLCTKDGKEGSYTMLLTVLDRRPYKVQNGPNKGKVIKNSRKLFMVKGRNLSKFERQWKKYANKPNAWRGMRVACHRTGDKEAAIGEDLEFLSPVKETILKKYKENSVPAEYAKIFPIPTAKELSERYNLEAGVAGSEEFDDDDEGVEGVAGW